MLGHWFVEVQPPLVEDELGPLDALLDALLDGLPEELLAGPPDELLAGPPEELLAGPLEEPPVELDVTPPEPIELELAEVAASPPAALVELVPAPPAPPLLEVDWSR
jgi:hypothetical protein